MVVAFVDEFALQETGGHIEVAAGIEADACMIDVGQLLERNLLGAVGRCLRAAPVTVVGDQPLCLRGGSRLLCRGRACKNGYSHQTHHGCNQNARYMESLHGTPSLAKSADIACRTAGNHGCGKQDVLPGNPDNG